jgi:hypothetical protein
LVEKAGGTSVSEIKRITNIDFNTATGVTTQTILTDNNGTFSATDENGVALTEYQDNSGNLHYTSAGYTINVSGLTGTLLTYWYSHSAANNTITITYGLTHSAHTGDNYHSFTGYTLTLASTTDDLVVYVTEKDGTYTVNFVANGVTTSVQVGSTVPVAHA